MHWFGRSNAYKNYTIYTHFVLALWKKLLESRDTPVTDFKPRPKS